MGFDFRRRFDGLQEQMEKFNLDLVVYGSCQNFQYLTGLNEKNQYWNWRRYTDLGSSVENLFVARNREPILTLSQQIVEYSPQRKTSVKDVRILDDGPLFGFHYGENYGKLVRKVINDLNIKGQKIGIGDHIWGSTTANLAEGVKNAEFHPAGNLIAGVRATKDDEEIRLLREAAVLTDKVMENVIPKITEGVTQHDIETEVEFQGQKLGASDVDFRPTAIFHKTGSKPSIGPASYPKEKGLVPGTSIAFDIGFVKDGYCSDFGRSFYYGTPDSEMKQGYAALHSAILSTVDRLSSDGLRACDLFPILEKYLEKLGFGKYLPTYLPELLGHSIGIEAHELPWLTPRYKEEIVPNMVMAWEPRIWRAGKYYMRVEDMILVGKRKAKLLTQFDRNLFQLSNR
jgi:Xaa-Pro dipeptidase